MGERTTRARAPRRRPERRPDHGPAPPPEPGSPPRDQVLRLLVHLQPAWASNPTKRITKSPKILVSDVGLAASLLDLDAERLRTDRKLFGQLLESFVVLELHKQLGWSGVRARLHHFRSYRDHEVDAVLERPDGRLAGIEVKAAVTLDRKDFRGLLALQEEAGERFERGIVLHLGERVVPFGERLWALPLSALWHRGG